MASELGGAAEKDEELINANNPEPTLTPGKTKHRSQPKAAQSQERDSRRTRLKAVDGIAPSVRTGRVCIPDAELDIWNILRRSACGSLLGKRVKTV